MADFEAANPTYVEGDYTTGLKQLLPLVEPSDAGAQLLLGRMYDKGEGVPKDFIEASRWYRKAAEQGHVVAQSHLAAIFQGDHSIAAPNFFLIAWTSLRPSGPSFLSTTTASSPSV